MNILSLEKIIDENLKNKTQEYKRLFHGRGNFYEDFNYLTIDSIDDILFATIFEKINKDIEKEIIDFLEKIYEKYNFKTLVLQRRYLREPLKIPFKAPNF